MLQRRVDRITGVARNPGLARSNRNAIMDLYHSALNGLNGSQYFLRADGSGIGRYRKGGKGGHDSP